MNFRLNGLATVTLPRASRCAGRNCESRARAAATWALQWLDRLEKATLGNPDYRTSDEREAVLRDISRGKAFYQSCSAGREGSGESAR